MSATMIEIDRCNDDLLDGTDYACPAWWRGNDRAVTVVCQLVHNWLNGEFEAGNFAGPALNELRARMMDLDSRMRQLRDRLCEQRSVDVIVPLHDGSVIHLADLSTPNCS